MSSTPPAIGFPTIGLNDGNGLIVIWRGFPHELPRPLDERAGKRYLHPFRTHDEANMSVVIRGLQITVYHYTSG